MFRSARGGFRYAPSDLVAYLEGDFAAWCERAHAERDGGAGAQSDLFSLRPDQDEEREIAARRGHDFEHRFLADLKARQPGLVEIGRGSPSQPDTLAAMRAGAPIIYQAHLSVGEWHGYPDFLFRVGGSSTLGGYHYVPWDTKLARSARPYFLVQLCAYAELLESLQGQRPAELVFVLGQGEERRFPTQYYFHYYRQLKAAFLAFQAAWRPDATPDPGLDRSWGRWTEAAQQQLADADHLSRVANITRGQVRRLEDAGISTLSALAVSTDSRVARITPPVFDRLRVQAQLQITSRDRDRPVWHYRDPDPSEPRRGLALLPPPSTGDIFFDMEGFPFAEQGLEYLFGAVTAESGSPVFHDWWAHDPVEERRAFEEFVDWVMARWQRDPGLHIYHYAAYETSTIRRLMGKYATRESEVDQMLRGRIFVDLFTVVRQGFLVGTASYSLKDIERLYLPPREGDVTTAGGSVIEYQRWLDSGEPRTWNESPILTAIRDYNRVDCESTRLLRQWLLQRQAESGTPYVPTRTSTDTAPDEPPTREPTSAALLAARLLARAEAEVATDPERARVTQLLGWLVEFHRREEKPMWWRMFDRHAKTVEELADDFDCLAGLERTATPPRSIKQSWALEYRFDPDQDTRLRAESKCLVAGTDLKCEIESFDGDRGALELKIGPGKELPERLSLIPYEFVSAATINAAIARYADGWEQGNVLSRAVDDLLFRRPPRRDGHVGGTLIGETGELLPQVIECAARLDGTTLCIQGPPGTGKTFSAAAIIVELMRRGQRIGVTATSHKVILNLLQAVVKARGGAKGPGRLYKVGTRADDGGDPLFANGAVTRLESKQVAEVVGDGPVLVGGTAWVFSRPELAGRFDYLFIDEAGQVALANAVAMGQSARNLVLVGDQMQLGQPIQGTHPGETGRSALDYLLHGHATVPADRGIFLGTSYRMHQSVCRFISDAIYDGRLGSALATGQHRILPRPGATIGAERGVCWVPVPHEGCTQASEEEVDRIEAIVRELLTRSVVDRNGGPRPMVLDDILLVAPFNLQVRLLKERLGQRTRVGSVDRFQGQEAPVVIVSLCASTLDEAPRGAEFLLNPNRLNVAVSRAEALAIVVGSPQLLAARPRTVEEMRLVNLLCRLVQYGEG